MSASSLGKRPRQNLAPATKLADANNTEQAGPFNKNPSLTIEQPKTRPLGHRPKFLM